ncbi:MAG: hypothetical protein ABI895_11420 [Deltaproteobacteria bacterium]
MSSPEIDLFVEHATWLAPRLPDPSRQGLVAWLAANMGGEAVRWLIHRMPLRHPVQQQAEDVLIDLLQHDFIRAQRTRQVLDRPDRAVDWAETYLRACGRSPTEFVSYNTRPSVDMATVSALKGIASTWALALEACEDDSGFQIRAAKLRRACEPYQPWAPAPFDAARERAIARLGAEGKAALVILRKAFGYWQDAFGEDGDNESLRRLAAALEPPTVSNVNTLLELAATLSIVRTALTVAPTGSAVCWELAPESWQFGSCGIELRAEAWRCRISKGLLTEADGKPVTDGLNQSLKAMGLDCIGNQPDIVIRFWHSERPWRTIFALADAKRNRTGNGENYLRCSVEAAAAYAFSYAHVLGLYVDVAGGVCRGLVNPLVTLFCAQGVGKVLGAKGSALEQANALRTASKLPAILAFDLQSHFGPTDGPWDSPVVNAWFTRICTEACTHLTSERGSTAQRRYQEVQPG